jgi:hypothetical protein
MATNTYVALDKIIIATATPSVTFSAISSAYTDLVILINAKASTVTNTYIRVGNGSVDTGSNYSRTQISSTGSVTSSGRNANQTLFYCDNNSAPDAANFNYTNTIYLMNYSNTNVYKTFLNQSGNAGYGTEAQVGLWRSNSAINTVLLGVASGNWAVGTTFELYGILAEGVSPTTKATGGAVYSDSTYYYHVFGASGTFTPTQSITADYIVIAGGGGGGKANSSQGYAGGGGAGGFRYGSATLSATGYVVTVGSGGAGSSSSSSLGANGVASSFNSLATTGGGGGASGNSPSQFTGAVGGSGGGSGGAYGPAAGNSGSYSPVEGYAGGQGDAGVGSTGGGGGAGAVGGNGTGSVGGNGGIGSSTYSSWGIATGVGENISGTYYFAGGGGGTIYAGNSSAVGIGGFGGGGNGGNSGGTPTAGRSNSGSGGGGAGSSGSVNGATGGNGGSGVVIVRYAK